MMRVVTCVIVALALGGCATLMMRDPTNANRDLTIIAHRGASGHAPENTLAAFKLATESHADYFELDCRLSKDNVVVISHDADLEKVTGQKLVIADLTLAQLQAYDVGSWFDPKFSAERMRTLSQSLDVATKDCGVYVEIKAEVGDGEASDALVVRARDERKLTDNLHAELMRIAASFPTRSIPLTLACIADIRAKQMEKRVVIQSFSPLICFIARTEAPEIRTELLLTDDEDDASHFDRTAHFGMLIGVEGINVSKKSLTPERLKNFQDAGKTVAVYTLNEQEEQRRFAEMGVNAIITDFPAECRSWLKGIR